MTVRLAKYLAPVVVICLACLASCSGGGGGGGGGSGGGGGGSSSSSSAPPVSTGPALVFVSRQINNGGSIYYAPPKDMPGIGPHSRFDAAAPGKLVVREGDGTFRVLIDGTNPSPSSRFLVDVNGPDVSYDARTIVFSGLPNASRNSRQGVEGYAGAWRLYVINVDGTGLRQLTQDEPDRAASLASRNLPMGLSLYDDGDPIWLPSGDIAFSSTRWPGYGHYSGVRMSNLYTIRADGSGLRRITGERNGADRPSVDPITGKIVYARWWRNHRFPVNSMATITDPAGGYRQKDGITADRSSADPSAEKMFRNAWQIASINPDGTDLSMWSGVGRAEAANHAYGGSFDASGNFYANFFPMYNMTEAGGFGGIRKYRRGPNGYTPILGVTDVDGDQTHYVAPNSFGIYKIGAGEHWGEYYASEPAVLPDGRLVVSLAKDTGQDYGLYLINADGTGVTPLYDLAGTSELRARPIVARPLPPVLASAVGPAPSLTPPSATGTYDQDGVFSFEALNVYFNAPVDTDIVSAPTVGSAATIRFFIDHQRQSAGSFPNLDWPTVLGERTVTPAGAVTDPAAPAGVSLFEQLRDRSYRVPATGGPYPDGSAHVAGMNFGAAGSHARCVGCHAGHTQIPVPVTQEDIEFTNLAPGASVSVSSTRDANYDGGLIDRRVLKGAIWRYWTSSPGRANGEWVVLGFGVPVTVKAVVLYNPRTGEEANSTVQVNQATVYICADVACGTIIASKRVSNVSVGGTRVDFPKPVGRAVRVIFDDVTGTFYGARSASLAEIEVIARGEN